MTSPAAEVERLVLRHMLAHGENPILRWMASNTSIVSDATGNVKPAKDKSTDPIDGIVALIIAMQRAMRHGEEQIYPGGPVVVG